jgi:hypothetical protein
MGVSPQAGAGVKRAGPPAAARAALLALALATAAVAPAAAQQTHLLVVSGVSGEPQYADLFHGWGTALVAAAAGRHHVPEANIVYLAERPERAGSITGRATRENVEQAVREIAARAAPGDVVFIVLIGHGSFDGRESRFNLVGPNLTARDWADLLEAFPAQRVAFVNTTSASGGFIEALSGPNRAIVTATRDGRQNNATIFPQYFVEAFIEDVADADRNGRVSLLEAYTYARQEVARAYQNTSRLQTEHALLDDDGDGKGTAEPDPRAGGDGVLARALYLGGTAAIVAEDASPELRALHQQRDRIEAEVDALRGARATLDADRYETELERLLLELARTGQAIRALEANAP